MRLKPHHIVHLHDVKYVDAETATRLHSLQTLSSQYHGTVHDITAQSPDLASWRTEEELRAMAMQSYFHVRKPSISKQSTVTWTPMPITNLIPWEFGFEETNLRMQDFVGFTMYSEPAEPASLISALNGSVVHIIESTSSAIPTPYTALSRTRRYRVPYFDKPDRLAEI